MTRSTKSISRRSLPLVMLVAAVGLAGCVTTTDDPAPGQMALTDGESEARYVSEDAGADRRDDVGADDGAMGTGSADDSVGGSVPQVPGGEGARVRQTPDFENVPEVETPELPTPENFAPEGADEVRETLEDAIASPDVAILDVAGLRDEGPTAQEVADFGDGNPRSGSGELVILDEGAALACANTELALYDLDADRLDEAVQRINTAAEWAASSSTVSFDAWSEELTKAVADEGAIDPVPLIGIFAACLDGGYDI
jgi:hypothetical protein